MQPLSMKTQFNTRGGAYFKRAWNYLREHGASWSSVPFGSGNIYLGYLGWATETFNPFHVGISAQYLTTNVILWFSGDKEKGAIFDEKTAAKNVSYLCITAGLTTVAGGYWNGEMGEMSSGVLDTVSMVPTLILSHMPERPNDSLTNRFLNHAKENPYFAAAIIGVSSEIPWIVESTLKGQWGEVAVHGLWVAGSVLIGMQKMPGDRSNAPQASTPAPGQ